MKPAAISADRSYVNKSGRTERLVLRIGTDIPVTWFGDPKTEPRGEPVVEYIDTRLGKTHYGPTSGKKPTTLYLSAFATWAHAEVPEPESSMRP